MVMNEYFTGNPSDHEAFVRIVDPSNYSVAVTNLSRGTIPVRAGLNWAQNFAAEQATATETITSSRTLIFNDSGKFLICDSGSAIALTVPSDATAGWTGAVTVAACRKGVGAVTFAAGAGVTLRGDLATPAQYGSKGIVRIGTNEWTVIE